MEWNQILAIALGTGGTISALCFAANAKDAWNVRRIAKANQRDGHHDWADDFWRWCEDACARAALFFIIAVALWVGAWLAWGAGV
jgi:hypothetical protein